MLYNNTLKQELSTAKTYEHNRLDKTSIVDRHRCHMAAKFGLFVDEDHSKLPTLYRGRLDLAVPFTPSIPNRQNRNQVCWNICAGVHRSCPYSEVV